MLNERFVVQDVTGMVAKMRNTMFKLWNKLLSQCKKTSDTHVPAPVAPAKATLHVYCKRSNYDMHSDMLSSLSMYMENAAAAQSFTESLLQCTGSSWAMRMTI